jgi:uncharacterized cysteine cluster protein YcgN (CxxCxxCC family)
MTDKSYNQVRNVQDEYRFHNHICSYIKSVHQDVVVVNKKSVPSGTLVVFS